MTSDLMFRILSMDPMITTHGRISGHNIAASGICKFCVVYIDSAENTVVLQCRTADASVIDSVRRMMAGTAVIVSGHLQFGSVPTLTATMVTCMEVF